MATPKPFKISVPDSLLSFINQRVATSRIPPSIKLPESAAWSHGIPSDEMTHLQSYWEKKYDWRATEARINSHLQMFTLPIEEAGETLTIHFVHHQSSRPNAIPLLFQHGWPGSFFEVEKIIDLLTSPSDPSQQAYHVVAPSLPGFAFSSQPQSPDFNIKNMASVDHKLMLALGYPTYMVQGGDWGSIVLRVLAANYPDSCSALHLNCIIAGPPLWWRYPFHLISMIFYVVYQLLFQKQERETTGFNRMVWWMKEEAGYQEIQGTKPQTLSYALVDSPLGMLAWLREKMEFLLDKDYVWEEEEVITWAMMYIIPGHAGHATIYKNMKGDAQKLLTAHMSMIPAKVEVGVSIFPKDTIYIPRWWANVTVSPNITFWKEHAIGGHFPSTERPDVLAQDIREFTERLKSEVREGLRRSGKVK